MIVVDFRHILAILNMNDTRAIGQYIYFIHMLNGIPVT